MLLCIPMIITEYRELCMLSSSLKFSKLIKRSFSSVFTLFILTLSIGFSYEISLVEGDVSIDRPGKKSEKLLKSVVFQEWDRIKIKEKGKLNLSCADGSIIEVSKNSLLQFIVCKCSKKMVLRILKGRLRVVNETSKKVRIETLNAQLNVSKGKHDVIISAMNTLVAPREGDPVLVSTKQYKKIVEPGRYGLITSEGALIKTKVVAKKDGDDV